MPSYTVTVATGSQWFAGTDDYIYLSLVGSAGCSEKHLLDKPFYNDFERGAVRARGPTGLGETREGWDQSRRRPRRIGVAGTRLGKRPATPLGDLEPVEARPGPRLRSGDPR